MVEVIGQPDPWEKQDYETGKAFAAFTVYRGLAPHERSLRKAVIKQFGELKQGRLRQYSLWSKKFSWVARSEAWDQEVDLQGRMAALSAVKDMNDRHIRLAKALQQKAIERLRDLDVLELTARDIIEYLSASVKIERLAAGEPDEIIMTKNEGLLEVVDYSKMSTDQLRAMLAKQLIASGIEDVSP